MKIIIGSDHGGFKLKEFLKKESVKLGYEVSDKGTNIEESCDYPDIADIVSKDVLNNKDSIGILICGTGIGIGIAANKHKGIRAALCYDEYTAKMAREHNDANVLCMGGRTTSEKMAKEIVKGFLGTDAANELRHKKRIGKILNIEKDNFK